MSLAEQLPLPEYQPLLSAPREVAHAALLSLSLAEENYFNYRPDYMSESFAEEVAGELAALGVDATVVGTWLKNIRSQQGRSYAIDIATHEPSNVIPFPTRF